MGKDNESEVEKQEEKLSLSFKNHKM